MPIDDRWTNQQTEKRVEKNVQELNELLRLSPDDVHNRLLEIFLVNLMMTTRVTLLFTDLIVHLEEITQTIILLSNGNEQSKSTKATTDQRMNRRRRTKRQCEQWFMIVRPFDIIYIVILRRETKSLFFSQQESRLPSVERENNSVVVVHTPREDENRHESIDCYSTMAATREREKIVGQRLCQSSSLTE